MINRCTYLSVKRVLISHMVLVLCLLFFSPTEVAAQSNTNNKIKPEQSGAKRRQFHEALRKKGSKGNIKRKSKIMQNAYYRKKSSETRYPGNIWLDPKPKDFTAIKERVERTPARKNVKATKTRASYFKSTSNRMHRSFGGDAVVKNNKRLHYQYTSKVATSSIGKMRLKKPKYTRKKSARAQKYTGSIEVLPAAMQKGPQRKTVDGKRPSGKTMKTSARRQRNRAITGAKMTQSYRGDEVARLSSKRDRRAAGIVLSPARYKGDVKVMGRMKQNWNTKRTNKLTTKYSGSIAGVSKRQRKQQLQGKSYNHTGHRGNLKMTNRSGQWMNAKLYKRYNIDTYRGDIPVKSKNFRKQNLRMGSYFQTHYSGNVKVMSKRKQKSSQHGAKSAANYSGSIAGLSKKQRRQQLQGKSLNQTTFSGTTKILRRDQITRRAKKNAKEINTYSGNLTSVSKKRRQNAIQGKSMQAMSYSGDVKVMSRRQQDRYMKHSNGKIGRYSGELTLGSMKKRKQQLEGKSLNYSTYQGEIRLTRTDVKNKRYEHVSKTAMNYSGNVRMRTNAARDRHYKNVSDRNRQITGNYRVKTKLYRDIEQQILSARVQNYQGGPKTSLFSRIWLSLFDNSGKLEKVDNKQRQPKYDTREAKIWY